MYSIVFEKKALHDLNRLEESIKLRIWNKLQDCKKDPFRFLEPLVQIKGFKLRVGSYRVVIDVEGSVLKVLKIGHRKNIYDS